MGVHSGKFGVVNGMSTMRNWNITDSMSPQAYVASNTLFGTGRRRGTETWNGNFGCYGHTPPVMPGERFEFLGYTAPDNDVSGPGLRYKGNALVENVQISWNWGAGEIINAVVNFQGDVGLEIQSGANELYDLTVPTVPPVVGTKIQYSLNDGGAWADWENLLSAQLTLSCQMLEYVNSSSVDAENRVWTGRKAGNIDWTLAITEQDNDRAKFDKGDSIMLRLYVAADRWYELKWGQIAEFTGITVDRESAAIIQQTVNVNMNGFNPDAVSYGTSYGYIQLPNGEVWWPSSQPGTGSGTGT